MLRFLALFFLPPLNFILLALLGFLLRRRQRRAGQALLLAAAILFGLTTIPAVWIGAISLIENRTPTLTIQDPRAKDGADAIVVLGAGRELGAPELGGRATVQIGAYERLRFAARLQRLNGKPILVSGGSTGGGSGGTDDSEAALMEETLEEDFRVPVKWVEAHSKNTIENARLSAALLLPLGIKRIFLVTHAAHMPRARYAFEEAGFTVVPAPVGYVTSDVNLSDPRIYLPSPDGEVLAYSAIHEWIGLLWYRLRI